MGTREPPQPGGLTGTPAASCLRKKSSTSLENQENSATNRLPSVVKQRFCFVNIKGTISNINKSKIIKFLNF